MTEQVSVDINGVIGVKRDSGLATRATASVPLLDLSITLTQSAIVKWVYTTLESDPIYPDPIVSITHDFLQLQLFIAGWKQRGCV